MFRALLYFPCAILTFAIGLSLTIPFSLPSPATSHNPNQTAYVTYEETDDLPVHYVEPPIDDRVITSLKIKGIGLDSSYKDVIKKLGKPAKISKAGYDACAEAKNKFIYYLGLEIGFLEGERKGDFTVYHMEISSAKWKLDTGLTTGSHMSEVKRVMGESKLDNYEGFERLIYSGDSGGVAFLFKHEKVSYISWSYVTC